MKGRTIPFEEASQKVQDLVRESSKVRSNAYCRYSKFAVGAAIIAVSGKTYTGVNVENASYGMTTCAEQTAICKAVSEGETGISEVAVCADLPSGFTSPCGRCRQIIAEFGSEVTVYLVRSDLKEIFITSIDELLPYTFALL